MTLHLSKIAHEANVASSWQYITMLWRRRNTHTRFTASPGQVRTSMNWFLLVSICNQLHKAVIMQGSPPGIVANPRRDFVRQTSISMLV